MLSLQNLYSLISNVQRGPQDRPVYDVVMETIEISE